MYVPPEMVTKAAGSPNYTSAVDCWSAGIILWALLTGSLPFLAKDDRELFRMIAYEDLARHQELPPRHRCPRRRRATHAHSWLHARLAAAVTGLHQAGLGARLGARQGAVRWAADQGRGGTPDGG